MNVCGSTMALQVLLRSILPALLVWAFGITIHLPLGGKRPEAKRRPRFQFPVSGSFGHTPSALETGNRKLETG